MVACTKLMNWWYAFLRAQGLTILTCPLEIPAGLPACFGFLGVRKRIVDIPNHGKMWDGRADAERIQRTCVQAPEKRNCSIYPPRKMFSLPFI